MCWIRRLAPTAADFLYKATVGLALQKYGRQTARDVKNTLSARVMLWVRTAMSIYKSSAPRRRTVEMYTCAIMG